jgi:hypothetical protein
MGPEKNHTDLTNEPENLVHVGYGYIGASSGKLHLATEEHYKEHPHVFKLYMVRNESK